MVVGGGGITSNIIAEVEDCFGSVNSYFIKNGQMRYRGPSFRMCFPEMYNPCLGINIKYWVWRLRWPLLVITNRKHLKAFVFFSLLLSDLHPPCHLVTRERGTK